MKQCGYYATRALRIEKFFAFWGQDLDSHVTPLECGRAFRTKLDKDIDFIGRQALEEQQKVRISASCQARDTGSTKIQRSLNISCCR